MKVVLLNLSFVCLLIFVSNSAADAQCASRTFKERFKEANLVFSGTVIEVFQGLSGGNSKPRAIYKIKVKVEKIWKGVSSDKETQVSIGGDIAAYDLILSLRKNQKILVYAFQSERETVSGGCDVLRNSDAKRDLRKLKRETKSGLKIS